MISPRQVRCARFACPTARSLAPPRARSPRTQGSLTGRAASDAEKARGPARCVFKDADLTASSTRIRLGPERREAFIRQVRADAELGDFR